MKKYVNNSDMRQYVQKCELFVNNNQTVMSEVKETKEDKWYTVYSYGTHFPMYICDMNTGEWFGTWEKHSRTTTQHQNKTHPHRDVKYLALHLMKKLDKFGPTGFIMKEIADAAGI